MLNGVAGGLQHCSWLARLQLNRYVIGGDSAQISSTALGHTPGPLHLLLLQSNWKLVARPHVYVAGCGAGIQATRGMQVTYWSESGNT